MSSNPYIQVALTYIRRPFSSGRSSYALACLFFGCVLHFCTGHNKIDTGFAILCFYVFCILSLGFVLHTKEQFASSRAHLMPGFRAVHATVAAAAALICTVLLPTIIAWHLGRQPLGLVAVVLLLFGADHWMATVRSSWQGLVWVAALITLMTESGQAVMRQIVSGDSGLQAVAILILGSLISVLAGIRMVRRSDEVPEYRRPIWDRSRIDPQVWPREERMVPRWWDRLAERQMARLVRHAQRASASWWSRICRWQVGIAAGWSILLWSIAPDSALPMAHLD